MRKSRDKNIGWRIDYFLTNESISKNIISCDILINCMGSDHAPIIMEINI